MAPFSRLAHFLQRVGLTDWLTSLPDYHLRNTQLNTQCQTHVNTEKGKDDHHHHPHPYPHKISAAAAAAATTTSDDIILVDAKGQHTPGTQRRAKSLNTKVSSHNFHYIYSPWQSCSCSRHNVKRKWRGDWRRRNVVVTAEEAEVEAEETIIGDDDHHRRRCRAAVATLLMAIIVCVVKNGQKRRKRGLNSAEVMIEQQQSPRWRRLHWRLQVFVHSVSWERESCSQYNHRELSSLREVLLNEKSKR